MSHRRESGAIPPWVVVEPKASPGASKNSNVLVNHGQESDVSTSGKHHGDDVTTSHTTRCEDKLASGDHTIRKEIDPLQCLHITGGDIVNADCTERADILVANGRVVAIGSKLDVPKGCPTLDASGLLIMPGGLDIASYIQNDLFGFDVSSYENTTKEALLGGTTTIIDTIICPKGQLPFDVFVETRSRVKNAHLWCNVAYRIGLVELNMPIMEQMERLVKDNKVNSFLFFVQPAHATNTGTCGGINPEQLRHALEKCRQWGVVAFVRVGSCTTPDKNSFDSTTDQEQTETKTVEQVLSIAEETNCPIVLTSPQKATTVQTAFMARRQIPPIHVQVTCAPSILLPITENGKPCPSHFLNHLSVSDIIAVSSDQSGGNPPTGSARLGAIGQRLVAVWEAGVPTGWLDASSFVAATSSNAARLAGLYPAKGRISQGSDADFVLWPVGGCTQPGAGRPIAVFLRGKLMAREGKLANQVSDSGPYLTTTADRTPMPNEEPKPQGTYVDVQPFPTAVYGPVRATDRLRRRHQYITNRGPWSMGAMSAELNAANDTAGDEKKRTGTERAALSSPNTCASPGDNNRNVVSGIPMVHGHRDLQASSFSLSGAQVDDNQPLRTGIRTCHPPGGASRNPLW